MLLYKTARINVKIHMPDGNGDLTKMIKGGFIYYDYAQINMYDPDSCNGALINKLCVC